MNISLKNRVGISFIIANIVILVVSFTVFNFLNSLNKKIESITVETNRLSLLTDEIRISAVSILKYQRRLLTKEGDKTEIVGRILDLADSFTGQLQNLDAIYSAGQNPEESEEGKKIITKMISYVDSLKIYLSKGGVHNRDQKGIDFVAETADKILDGFSEFQDIQYLSSLKKDKDIKDIINETKKIMMIVLIMGFLGTIILGLVVPGKIALPFKKIKDAIRELQDCNFDVSIYYSQDDEIGEIAREMNKMIAQFKKFEELRTDRISVENRKFDALANMIRKPVLVANADGKLIYMNNNLYSLMQVQSEDVIGKPMTESVIPPSIIDTYELAIKRRSKIENAEVIIPKRVSDSSDDEDEDEEEVALKVRTDESGEEDSAAEREDEIIFRGYANVIPIRAKESSLDYYLMVLSKEVNT